MLIRWSVQRGLVSIPKSSNPGRIAENGDVLTWALSDEQVAMINSLNSDFRYFISYLKKPDNNEIWHDSVFEHQPIL